jgi:hypothetical protein
MIKILVHTTMSCCYASTLEVSIVPSIHPIKINLRVWCDLSLQKHSKKETWAMKKERKKERTRKNTMLKA